MTGLELLGMIMLLVMLVAIFIGLPISFTLLFLALIFGFLGLGAPVRGSLYIVVLLTATLFGIAAGTVGATVALLGIMAGPMMIRSGYDVRMSAGAIAAGGTLGILIPPSVMLVVMAPVLDISIIDLYAAAFG